MAKDQYMLNPMFLSSELAISSSQNIVESVPVSQFKPYLEAAYGPGIPRSRSDAFIADGFFEAATAYSTDETMGNIILNDRLSPAQIVTKFIPRWLQLTEPLVDAARLLDKTLARHTAAYDKGAIPRNHNNDMTFMAGIFYASTQMASVALDIPHPSQSHPDLLRPALNSGRNLVGGQPHETLPQTKLLLPPYARAEDIRKVDRLKLKTTTLNARAQQAAEKVIAICAAIEGMKELDLILEEQRAE